jgi:hypothetical protein
LQPTRRLGLYEVFVETFIHSSVTWLWQLNMR